MDDIEYRDYSPDSGHIRTADGYMSTREYVRRVRGMTVEQMGRELGAHFVIEGSVRGQSERIRINVRLVQVSNQGTR